MGNLGERGKIWTGAIVTAFLASVSVFFLLVQTEKKMLAPYEKATAIIVDRAVPKGILLTEENLMSYVKYVEWDKNCIPKSAICEADKLYGKKALFSIEPGILVAEGMFQDFNEVVGAMEEPVITGFRVDDLSQVAGGILRSGDIIHVFCKKEDGTVEEVRDQITIQQVFDSSGNRITNDDQISVAQRINIFLDKKEVEGFYQKIGEGVIQVVKENDL